MKPSGLAVSGLSASYDGRTRVLEDINFSAEPGEAIAVIGPSGAGKSTLFRALARLSAPVAGTVRLEGLDLYERHGRRQLRGRIGYIHQRHALPVGISCVMAVLGGEMHHWRTGRVLGSALTGPSREELDRASVVLERVGLAGREYDRVSELSIGQQQRVAVARTLLQSPSLIIADEPVAAVDPVTADVVLGLLTAQAAQGAIVLCSVHDPKRAREHFPRIIGIGRRTIAFDLPSEQVTDQTAGSLYIGEAA
jgi:phosphonate transport system ATP-binding protein